MVVCDCIVTHGHKVDIFGVDYPNFAKISIK